MTRKQQRIYAILLILSGVIIATFLTLAALRDTVTFFYSPSDIIDPQTKEIDIDRPFRLGGMVVYGSIEKDGTITRFAVTDYEQDITIEYDGILPALFQEGQGTVAIGIMRSDNIFIADQLLAKHDENYMPPEVAESLHKARHPGESRDLQDQQQKDSGLRRNDE